MDYIIKQSRLEKIIWEYLDKTYYPDYMWNEDKDDYKREVQNFGYLNFEKNDQTIYEYYDSTEFYSELGILKVYPNMVENLDGFFDKYWIPVFAKWFEYHTGLNVNSVRFEGRTLYRK